MYFLLGVSLMAAGEEPFSVSAALHKSDEGKTLLSVSFSISDRYYLDAGSIKIQAAGGVQLLARTISPAKPKRDESTGKTVEVYEKSATFIYTLEGNAKGPISITVDFQGCGENICFPPTTKTFLLARAQDDHVIPVSNECVTASTDQPTEGWRALASHFTVAGREAGYLDVKMMMRFLDTVERGNGLDHDRLGTLFHKNGIWLAIFLILLGGLALNLTPCVLPMIPINIAIIGAGANAGSRTRGFVLGAAYGAAMAVVYGILGLMVVLTGSTFGTLNASPLFNAIVAVVFLLLSLAMFGIFPIDFSRFQGTAAMGKSQRGNIWVAFSMGAVAALLAGACVAPVLISVLLLATNLYEQGNPAGIFLPFLLGIGMGIPWPFVGGGLSFLPKPGKWMNHVKYAFGVIILGFAFYYGILGYKLLINSGSSGSRRVAAARQAAGAEDWHTSLKNALAQAWKENKPVFIDFQASWCKSCHAMEKTTFNHPGVKERLEKYVGLKFDAENPKDPEVKSILDNFGVIGLPTCVVLAPKTENPPSAAGPGK